ncbi:MAG: undecaprenyl-diphosphate phosphatase [Phycisphaerales bacterium]
MTILDAVILGIVEGITEYLPVSSTGHLILTAWLLGLDRDPATKQAVDAFNIIIQGGAILAVLGLYRTRVLSMLRGLVGKDPAGLRLLVNLFVAFLPAAVLGLLFDDWIEAHLFRPVPVLAALGLGGVLLIGIGPWLRKARHEDADAAMSGAGTSAADPALDRRSIESMTWKRALVVGMLQPIAMWPGTSRSMMTIVGGMVTGLRPKDAAEFSFLLGLPTLGGACVYKAAKSVANHDGGAAGFIADLGGIAPVVVGIAVATLSAAIAVKWLVGYLTKHGMALFGWWRIALCVVMAIGVWQGWVSFDAAGEAGAALVAP